MARDDISIQANRPGDSPEPAPTLLIVDDEQSLRFSIGEWARDAGFHPVAVANGADAVTALSEHVVDVVLLDLRLGSEDGLEVFKRLRDEDALLPIVMLTGHGSIEHAVKATRMGVFDFMIKPPDLGHLEVVIRRALEHARLQRELEHLRRNAHGNPTMLGESAPFRRVQERLQKAARSSSVTVLVLGETGAGKELMAQFVHRESPRGRGPFIDINCAAIPEQLLESELFGHEKGAFTDARRFRKGLFELADGGTLFLDEIGEMTVNLQAKLLRVLENGTFRRVGGSADLTVDVRVVAATHRDLKKAMAEGRFREDLYFRLNEVSVTMPPLRERAEDVPLLADHFIRQFCARHGRSAPRLGADAIGALRSYAWPGNVRELRNVLHSVLVFEDGDEIRAEHLPAEILSRSGPAPVDGHEQAFPPGVVRSLAEVERMAIEHALVVCGGNKTRAAEKLQISRQTLRTKLKEDDLPDDAEVNASS